MTKAEIPPTTKPLPSKAAPSSAASRNIADLYLALEDGYDRATKCYKNNLSDAAIATQLGMSEAFVTKRREEDFGPIVERSPLKELSKTLDGVQSVLKRLEEIEVLFPQLMSDLRFHYSRLRDRAAEIGRAE